MHVGRQIVRTRPYAAPWSGQCGVGREKHLQRPFRAAACAEWRCQTCPAAAPNGLFRPAIRPVLQCQTAACRSRLCASHLRRGPRRRCLAAQIVTKNQAARRAINGRSGAQPPAPAGHATPSHRATTAARLRPGTADRRKRKSSVTAVLPHVYTKMHHANTIFHHTGRRFS